MRREVDETNLTFLSVAVSSKTARTLSEIAARKHTTVMDVLGRIVDKWVGEMPSNNGN